jgi:hypothetical protein
LLRAGKVLCSLGQGVKVLFNVALKMGWRAQKSAPEVRLNQPRPLTRLGPFARS